MEDYLPESLCRTCLQSSDQLTSLYLKDDDTGLTLLDKLRFCSSMQVPVSEHTPSNACAPCVRCITDYYDFKRRCEQSEKTLEELFVEYTVPKVEVFPKEEEDDGDISKVAAKTEPDNSSSLYDDGSDWTNISEEVDGATIDKILTPGQLNDLKEKHNNLCDMYTRPFPTDKHLKRYKMLSQSARRHRCDRCGASYLQAYRLRLHMETHKEGSKYVCEMCGKVYRSAKWLRIHKTESHDAEKPVYKCRVCGKTYNSISSLNAHRHTHKLRKRTLNLPSFKCDICKKSFKTKHDLRKHIHRHLLRKRQCDGCKEVFDSLPEMLKHRASAHPELHPYVVEVPDNRPSCGLCKRTFSDRSSLRRHLRLHTVEQPKSPIDPITEVLSHQESSNSDVTQHDNEGSNIIDKNLTSDPIDDLKKKDKHLCDMCPRSYPSDRHLKRHKMLSHSERRHICVQCGASFPEAYRLRLHMETHEQGSKYICEKCGKAYKGATSLRIHMTESHGAHKPVYECKVCGKTYNFISSLNAHKRTHNRQKRTPKAPGVGLKRQCDGCDEVFNSLPKLLEHKASAHPDLDPHIVKVPPNRPSCDFCKKTFSSRSYLRRHLRLHAPQQITSPVHVKTDASNEETAGQVDDLKEKHEHLCDQCPRSFATIKYLRSHKRNCHSDRRHQCDQCGSSFSQAHNLRRHLKSHVPGVKFICETCGKEYSFEESLRLHIEEKHSAEKPIYTCKVCGKTYNCKASINTHKRTHKAVKNHFRCDRCDGAFPSRTRLVRHVKKTHDKQYSCDMCDKRFAIEVGLLKHKAYHAIEMAKPYACTLCKKRFSTTSAVSFHVSTLHNGKKHLKCDVCGMEFYNRFHYAAHYSSHTGIKPYRCDGCGLGYNYNRDLKKHKKSCSSLLELARQ